MNEVRKADRVARRRALALIALSGIGGAVLIIGFEQYSTPLREWLLAEPQEQAHRVKLLCLLIAALLSAPLIAFAVHLWSLGSKVIAAAEFPPPGYPVVRDTRVIAGPDAATRGKVLRALALGVGLVSVLLWVMLWRLASALGGTLL